MFCIISHNMIVEDERDGYIDGESDNNQDDPNRSRRARAKIYDGPNLPFNPRTGNEYMRRYRMIRFRATNKYLQQARMFSRLAFFLYRHLVRHSSKSQKLVNGGGLGSQRCAHNPQYEGDLEMSVEGLGPIDLQRFCPV
ncbi:hypothetical protein DVH24_034059 [Malus domestica]|uniref:Uncharacterized protein n=1 Tax=Malus domestica TaxID=3750 RepID=A0A498KUK6_MALDO|nr:hypothetical protein DVH24_034059 [Malus domestica]